MTTSTDDTTPRLCEPRALAARLDCSTETLTRLVREGRLPCYRFGDKPQQWRYDPDEVLRILRYEAGREVVA